MEWGLLGRSPLRSTKRNTDEYGTFIPFLLSLYDGTKVRVKITQVQR